MNTLTSPPQITGAFNPVILQLQQGNEQDAGITLQIDGSTYRLTRDYLGGKARYNLSELIKQEFKNEQEYIQQDIFSDKLLAIPFSATSPTQIAFNSTAIRAVRQENGPYDMTQLRGSFLTGFKTVKRYTGYPLYISFLTVPNNTCININGITYNNQPLTGIHLTINVPDYTITLSITQGKITEPLLANTGETITTNTNKTIHVLTGILEQEKMNIDHPCTPQSPLYIRWINRLGGWDAWMFKNRQFKKSELTKTETFRPTIEEYTRGPAEADHVLNAEAKETITAGEENLTENEYDNLHLLKYSPLIQQYNKETGEWSRIYLEKADTEKDTGATRFALEFEFTLPTPKLQF
jgi:hypothetical protein